MKQGRRSKETNEVIKRIKRDGDDKPDFKSIIDSRKFEEEIEDIIDTEDFYDDFDEDFYDCDQYNELLKKTIKFNKIR